MSLCNIKAIWLTVSEISSANETLTHRRGGIKTRTEAEFIAPSVSPMVTAGANYHIGLVKIFIMALEHRLGTQMNQKEQLTKTFMMLSN